MCGLWGVIASKKENMANLRGLNNFAKDACIMGTVRGEDSTGVFQHRKAGENIVYKLPYNGILFAKHTRALGILNNVDISTCTIGHHRAMTRGGICADNSHPFEHRYKDRHVIGAHNGVITGAPYREDDITFEVDSSYAMYSIAKYGGPEGVGRLDGAMSLAWWEGDGKLRLFSNGKRPLHFAFAADSSAMMFMSEDGMLWALAQRNQISIKESIYYPSEDECIYIFDPEVPGQWTTEKIVKPKVVAPAWKARTASGNSADLWEHDNERWGAWRNDHTKLRPGPEARRVELQRTPQGKLVIENAAMLKNKLDMKIGEDVLFFTTDTVENNYPTCLIGEIIQYDGSVVDYGIIIGINQDIKDNITRMSDAGGEIKCEVKGHTTVTVKGIDYTAAVLSPPTGMVGAEGEVVPKLPSRKSEAAPVFEIPGPEGRLITKLRFAQLCKEGCAGCSTPMSEKMAKDGEISWHKADVGDPQPLCSKCKSTYLEPDKTEAVA